MDSGDDSDKKIVKEPLVEYKYSIPEIAKKDNNTKKRDKKNRAALGKMFCVIIICMIFMGVEITGGLIADSIAILSDAAHLLSDLLGFVISVISIYISGLPASESHSFGYHRAGIIGALASVMLIWVLTAFLVYFATLRVMDLDAVEVDGQFMFYTACFALVANLVMAKALHGGHDHSHDHGHGHSHDHSHSHSHGHHHKHEHKHDHKHDHSHDHGDHKHEHKHDHAEKGHDHKHEDFIKSVDVDDLACKCDSPTRSKNGSVKSDAEDEGTELVKQTEAITVKREDIEKGNDALKIKENKKSKVIREVKGGHHHHDHENMNVRAAIIHIIGDILQSIGVMIASGIIWWRPEYKIADPICTYIFSVIVMFTTFRITKDCIFVLMESTPKKIDVEEFKKEILEKTGATEIHDLHIWMLNEGKVALSAHVATDQDPQCVLKKVTKICRHYGMTHTTIQMEDIKDPDHMIDCEQDLH